MSPAYSIDSLFSNILFNNKNFSSFKFSFNPKNFMEINEGSLIYKTGDLSDSVYLIVKGEVKLKNINSKKLTTKSVNDYFGEPEVLDDSPRISSAMANTDCIIYQLDGTTFKEIFNKSEKVNPDIPVDDLNSSETILDKIDLGFSIDKTDVDTTISSTMDENNLDADSLPNDYDSILEEMAKIENQEMNDETGLETLITDDEKISDSDLNDKLVDEYSFTEHPYKNNIIEDEIENEAKEQHSENEASTVAHINESYFHTDEKKQEYVNNDFNKYEGLLKPSADSKKTAKDILHFLLEQTDSKIGAFYIYNPEDNRLEDFYQTSESFYKTKKSLKNGITSLVAKDKKIRIVTSYLNDSNFNAEIDLPNDFTGNTIIFIPIVSNENNLLAIVQIGSNQNDFTKDEEISIEQAARYCSIIYQKSFEAVQPLVNDQETKFEPESDYKSDSKSASKSAPDLSLIANFILQDVKAPLTNIKNYSAILSKYQLPDEVRKVIALISAQSTSIIDLIQSSIDYSERNKNLAFEVVSFNDTLNQILTLLSDYVESRNVKLFKKLSNDVNVNIDVHKLYVACYYISKFACDLMPENGKLYFSSYVDNQNVILKIKDESKGINDDFINNISENLISETKEDVSVLGLKIAKYLVEVMNAKLIIESSETGIIYLISIPSVID